MTASTVSPDSILTISSADELSLLRTYLKSRRSFKVQIQVPGLEKERRDRLQRRVERSASACGCNEGSIAGLLYLIAVPALYFTGRIAPSASAWLAIGGGFIATLLIGKLIGLAAAKLTLTRTLAQLERAFRSSGKDRNHVV